MPSNLATGLTRPKPPRNLFALPERRTLAHATTLLGFPRVIESRRPSIPTWILDMG